MCEGLLKIESSIGYMNGCFLNDLYENGTIQEKGTSKRTLLTSLRRFLFERTIEFDQDIKRDPSLLIEFSHILLRIEEKQWKSWKLWQFDHSFVLELINSRKERDSECFWM